MMQIYFFNKNFLHYFISYLNNSILNLKKSINECSIKLNVPNEKLVRNFIITSHKSHVLKR
jgi:hypothetical protein